MKGINAQSKRFIIALLMLTFPIFFLHSCKKEIGKNENLEPVNLEQQKKIKEYLNGPKINTIEFAAIQKKLNGMELGTLNIAFRARGESGKIMNINTPETFNGFAINTDSVVVISTSGHTSYVFSVQLASERAVTFQNLTIDESKDGISAFVTTYTPTRSWIDKLAGGIPGQFEGSIGITKINLSGSTLISPLLNETSTSRTTKNQAVSSIHIPGTIALAQQCTSTTFFYQIPYNCANGNHGPGEACIYEGTSNAAGYATLSGVVTECTTSGDAGGGGGGGGGGTTPSVPPGYNPCPTVPTAPIPVSSIRATGQKFAVRQDATPCDPVAPPVAENPKRDIKNQVTNPCVKSAIDKALGINIQSKIETLMNNTFLANHTVNLTFMSYPFTSTKNADAYTNYYTGTFHDVYIAFNENTIKNHSLEYNVATVYHEVLHAYIDILYGSPDDPNNHNLTVSHHQYIADNFIGLMVKDMRTLFPTMTEDDALYLAWGGLEDSNLFAMKPAGFKASYYNTNILYSTKPGGTGLSKGSYCP